MRSVAQLLEVDGLAIGRADGWAVSLPELKLRPGQVAALYGPSGCGKTTVLQGLFGLLPPGDFASRGLVRLRGHEMLDGDVVRAAERRHALRHDVAFLLQDAHSALDPLQPVGEQIAQACSRSVTEAAAMLGELGVADAASLCARLPHQISGGQAQRALLAIAFLRRPALVLADEPSASLDGGSYRELVGRLQALVAAGSAVLLSTHDHRLLRDLDAAVYKMQGGAFRRGVPQDDPWPVATARELGTLPVLSARGLRVAYGGRVVLDGVDLQLRRNEIVAVCGESGAGKTTLARVLAGHRRPDAGTVDIGGRRRAVQLVCQDAQGSLTPGRSLERLVAEAKAPYFDIGATAAQLGLGNAVLQRPVERMSGGERRRAAVLRALAVQPEVLVLDEPTASLDRATARAVVEALLGIQEQRGLAMVLVTHDEQLASAVGHRTVFVEGGKLCER